MIWRLEMVESLPRPRQTCPSGQKKTKRPPPESGRKLVSAADSNAGKVLNLFDGFAIELSFLLRPGILFLWIEEGERERHQMGGFKAGIDAHQIDEAF